ncbi:hypothetical protein SAMN05421759_107113 [Roseivivax lentus]|uniref:Uncharacterized protein n=1 Tax=Roseivivax lentus TaxID=633194 RepID=A0A1N7N9V1_9RHOB|nr:curli-like amyloid fiber formation chaperone CsgH [Roseivivax lentus]SIS95110.1 hypothetical protein SAMN05421759_107113 [Roseivivax lentus]
MRRIFAMCLLSGVLMAPPLFAKDAPCDLSFDVTSNVVTLEAHATDPQWIGGRYFLKVELINGSNRSTSVQSGTVPDVTADGAAPALARSAMSLSPGSEMTANLVVENAGQQVTCEGSFQR